MNIRFHLISKEWIQLELVLFNKTTLIQHDGIMQIALLFKGTLPATKAIFVLSKDTASQILRHFLKVIAMYNSKMVSTILFGRRTTRRWRRTRRRRSRLGQFLATFKILLLLFWRPFRLLLVHNLKLGDISTAGVRFLSECLQLRLVLASLSLLLGFPVFNEN